LEDIGGCTYPEAAVLGHDPTRDEQQNPGNEPCPSHQSKRCENVCGVWTWIDFVHCPVPSMALRGVLIGPFRRSLGRLVAGCVPAGANRRRDTMGLDDKIQNAGEKLGGKGKEATGEATGDESLKAEGQGDQAKGDLKQAGEKVKDVFKKD
jgi:uncharacterized protein YjbJ (UPF0337 family)